VKHTASTRRKQSYNARTTPRSAKAHLGIELECFAAEDHVHTAMLSQVVVPCSDGSLPSFGCEFKVCRPAAQAIKRAVRLVTKLQAAGARVNKSCGLHVHMDIRHVPNARVVAFLEWMKANQAWFFGLFPRSRQPGTNGYIGRMTYADSTDHYVWCHRTHYNTIEIRIHGGTLNRHKLLGWLSAVKDLMELLRSSRELPELNTITENRRPKASAEWIGTVFTTPAAAEYITARQDANGVLESFEEQAVCTD
jgi:hypothetical protein